MATIADAGYVVAARLRATQRQSDSRIGPAAGRPRVAGEIV
jgi:hypothetical protein